MRVLRGAFVVTLFALWSCGDNHPYDVDAASPDADLPACADQQDNDGDGKIDFPYDPGCPVPQADDELDPCPDGAGCPQCGDAKDNDGNGKIDFPNDTGCSSAYDAVEFTDDPLACGQGMAIKQLPTTGMDMGSLQGTTSMVGSPCGGGNGLPAVAYVFHVTSPKVIVATTDDPITTIDTVLDLRASMCAASGAELACHDDVTPGTNSKSKITKRLKVGTYYLVVGGKTAADTGNYHLDVRLFPGEGVACTTAADCGPDLECRVPAGQMGKVCIGPVCDDGIDDDSDGKADYPLDPGCTAPDDSNEQDVCANAPQSPQCPACANGVDDDADGMTDYPADPNCLAASTTSEACLQSETIIVATQPQTTGTTAGAVNDYRPPAGSVNGHLCSTTDNTTATAPDVAVQLDVPALDSLTLGLNPVGYDSTHVLLGPTCGGTPIDCSDSPTGMAVTNLAAGRYYLIVDGYSSGSGTFTLNVAGTIKANESCESPLAQSGALTCASGYACQGTAGSRTCRPAECNDGIDNNTDGKTDFPADPGCATPSDASENTVCPGASCPICADGLDNDSDGLTDYPTDPSCFSASGTNESCAQSEAIGVITQMTTTGTTAGAVNDYTPTCGSSAHTAPDVALRLDVPAMATLSLNLTGFDSAHALLGPSCGGTAIACSDPALMTQTNIAAGTYYVVVDGWSTGSGPFTLVTTGTVAAGGSCEGSLFQSGAFTCTTGYSCAGPIGSRTCSPAQCNDTIDNDADGKIDYPADPGCGSTSDGTEADDCFPTVGPNCPACSNGVDDDMDMSTDYPTDMRCASASFFVENFCPMEANIAGMVVSPSTAGDLSTAANNFSQTCQTTTGNDVSFGLRLPVPVASLVIDTLNSVSADTVVSLWNVDCSTSLGCDDDGDPNGLRSLLTVTNVPAGDYAIQVDSYSTTNNQAIQLNVRGTVAAGTACTSELFGAGVLACPSGTTCTGGTCQ